MLSIEEIKEYFYNETEGFEIENIELADTKASYIDEIECYLITTKQKYNFYVFVGDIIPTNIYPIRDGESLDEIYYKHIGLMSELCSASASKNFILDYIKEFSVFPILDRKMSDISKDITLDKTSSQLSGLANQIRDCYLNLTDYLMNKIRTENPDFKNDNFTDNLKEFLTIILPGKQSETRRNVINSIAQKGWKLNSELVHKDSVTVFDILVSFNILQLVVSTVSNIIVGNDMPFNKIKCPTCNGEHYTISNNSEQRDFEYICDFCKTHFTVTLESIRKAF